MITLLLHRRRLLFWLLRAYIKKRKRTIFGFFSAGIFVGVLVYFLTPVLSPLIPHKTTKIGIVGSYTIETLPSEIQNKLSLGLTRLADAGEATPSAATFFEVSNDGKTYTFYLRDDLFWQDGKAFRAHDINYNFKDVSIQVENDQKTSFTLREPYAPFPTVLSQPIFRKGLIGLVGKGNLEGYGNYKVIDVDFSGTFIVGLTLEGITPKTKKERLIYMFYGNEEEAKIRFMLGEVDSIANLVNPKPFESWKNIHIVPARVDSQLVTVFYNTSFPVLSDKAVRQALTYALPSDFAEDDKASSPLNPHSWAYVSQNKFSQNIDTALKLLKGSKEGSPSGKLTLELTTTGHFKDLANRIASDWEKIGVATEVRVVDVIPSDPQILLERFKIPTDPDQYVLWHSTQTTNISHYSNPKIDKLLEDGRQTVNKEERAQIYADFQKYIVDEAPAAFLYHPTVYTVTRK